MLDFLIQNGQVWVEAQRDTYRPRARCLDESEKRALGSFFPSRTLERAHLAVVPQIENPPFYSQLPKLGIREPLDFTLAAGVTFDDTILIAQSAAFPLSLSLLFHELVHVVQYEVLGVAGFVENYVRGWAENNFDYFSIPLECEAYALQHRFESMLDSGFDVESEVRRA